MKRAFLVAWAAVAAGCGDDDGERTFVPPKRTAEERTADVRQETAAQGQADAAAEARIGREELAISVGMPDASADLQAHGRAEYEPACGSCHGAYAEGASPPQLTDGSGPINFPGLREASARMTAEELAAAMRPEAHSERWRAAVPVLDAGRRARIAGYLKAVWGGPAAAPPAIAPAPPPGGEPARAPTSASG